MRQPLFSYSPETWHKAETRGLRPKSRCLRRCDRPKGNTRFVSRAGLLVRYDMLRLMWQNTDERKETSLVGALLSQRTATP